MTWPPSGIDVNLAENVAATTIRRLVGVTLGWGEMVATAQAVLSHADDLTPEAWSSLLDVDAAAPLIAAARVLDAASDKRSGLVGEERLLLRKLAVVAYGMHGNFASAFALARRGGILAQGSKPLSPTQAVALACALPNNLPDLVSFAKAGSHHSEFLGVYASFLATGDDETSDEVRAALLACIVDEQEATYFDRSLMRLSRLALEQAIQLSVPAVLRRHSEIGSDVIERLVDSRRRVLLPPQYKAIAHHDLLRSTKNAMVALPTSTGKTMLGTLCLLQALGGEPGLVCYVTPYVATARQAADALQQVKPDAARLHRLIGGYDQTVPLQPTDYQEIVVATPERLDALLRSAPEISYALRAVVFDEAHLVENASRGVRLEGVLARLRILQDRGVTFRLVFLSAVLSPDAAVQRWLNVEDEHAVVDPWRPTARRTAVWAQSGRLEWFAGGDVLRRPGLDADDLIGHVDLAWPEPRIGPATHFGQIRAQEPLVRMNVAYLVDAAARRLGAPVLCVCATKSQTREIADAIAARWEPIEPLPRSLAEIRALIDERYAFLGPLRTAIERGVAYHNSSLPHDVRRLVEDAVASRELRAVAATTTLAEGVDLPFRVTVIADWLLWSEAGARPMSPTLFANIAGRAGRAGSFTEGDTILFDNPLGDPIFTHPKVRRQVQREFLHTEALPGLQSAFESAEDPTAEALKAALASQFLAAIPENSGVEDLPETLVEHMLVSHRHDGQHQAQVKSFVDEIRTDLLEPAAGQPLAIAQSPLRLTPLGEAANRSGFSPRSAQRILGLLTEELEQPELARTAAAFLRQLGDLPEQPSVKFRQLLVKPRTRFYVKPDDLETVFDSWLEGIAIERIFEALPTVERSSILPPIEAWLEGIPAPKWDVAFDSFVDFMHSVVQSFMPWLFRACETLAPHAGAWAQTVPWREWAELLERPNDELGEPEPAG